MESDPDISSENESENEEKVLSPTSLHSASGDSSPEHQGSHKSSRSPRSRSMSNTPESLHQSPTSQSSRPKTPKSPESHYSGNRSHSPLLNNHNQGPRSPSPPNSSRSHSQDNSKSSAHDDKNSFKSNSSRSSRSVSPDRLSVNSNKSESSRGSRSMRKAANLEDGNSSDSSASSVDSSSRRNKNINKNVDTQPEEISDGDMESDKSDNEPKSEEAKKINININHDDLSDVSDLDESIGGNTDNEDEIESNMQHTDEAVLDKDNKKVPDKSRPDDGEEQLDFEAEDGECAEPEITKEKDDKVKLESGECIDDTGEIEEEKMPEKEPEELEEGEVTDEDDVRPEETEPRPVCRFFSRGQCTWGASCRFLHPGVTDKGNYTMFELIRPVVPGEFGRDERIYGGNARPDPPPIESAWERGLRTAKEMLRKSIKRKEQDIDFEEKKMNLSLTQEELDKENGYYGRAPSPEPRYVSMRHPVHPEYPPVRPPPEEYYNRRQVLYEPEYAPVPRERVRTYRELPAHRMPDYYNSKYEEEVPSGSAKPRKTKREVIVQRVEERPARADEWSDPWMRSKSPNARKGGGGGGRKRSYSSGSSYSSSSSSRTSSGTSRSSYKSRSRSPRHKRSARSHRSRHGVSPSVIVNERKAANERAALMNPPAPRKKASSPSMARVGAQNPPAPPTVDKFGRTRSKLAVAAALARVKRQRSSHSSSESSGSSSSDTDSSGSSSSSSKDGSPPRRPNVDLALALKAKAIDALKNSSEKRQIKLNLKNPMNARKVESAELSRKSDATQGKKRPASPTDRNSTSKKATTRREELLKQLKAVEDAIAKKRSKVN